MKVLFFKIITLLSFLFISGAVNGQIKYQLCSSYQGIQYMNRTVVDINFPNQCPHWDFFPAPISNEKASQDPIIRHVGGVYVYEDELPVAIGTGTIIEEPNMILTAAHVVLNSANDFNTKRQYVFQAPNQKSHTIRKCVTFDSHHGYSKLSSDHPEYDKTFVQDVAILIAYEPLLSDASFLKVYNAEDSTTALLSKRPKFYAGCPNLDTILNTDFKPTQLFIAPISKRPFVLSNTSPFQAIQKISIMDLLNGNYDQSALLTNSGASGSALMVQEENTPDWKIAGVIIAGDSILSNMNSDEMDLWPVDSSLISQSCSEEELSQIPTFISNIVCYGNPTLDAFGSGSQDISEVIELMQSTEDTYTYILGQDFHEHLLPQARNVARNTLGELPNWETEFITSPCTETPN